MEKATAAAIQLDHHQEEDTETVIICLLEHFLC